MACDLTNHLLIALPSMADPNFAQSVTYIVEHNRQGALGVVINRSLDMTVGDLFERIDLKLAFDHLREQPVFYGGPVQTDRGFVLHQPAGEWHSSLKVGNDIALTSSKDILESLGELGFPEQVIISLGYAGWGAGQLEQELGENAWLSVPATSKLLFSTPTDMRYAAAMDLLGIDPVNLSNAAGHA